MEKQYFVVLDSGGPQPSQTIYPEVHYVFADDAFSPEADALERQPGDVSVMVDLDESGQAIKCCQSISPEWQVTNASLVTQALGSSVANQKGVPNSLLLQIQGVPSKLDQDIVSLKGSFDSQIDTGLKLLEQLEQRQEEIKQAISSFPNNTP